MLRQETDPIEREELEKLISDTKQGGLKRRMESLKLVPVVGVTCAAASFRTVSILSPV